MNKDIKSQSKHYYLFLSVLDNKKFLCITSRKEDGFKNFTNRDCSKIIIVKEEIESWYLAGVDTSLDIFKNLKIPDSTDSIEKETLIK